ncbi:hypothetical protein HPB51_026897 [Rhipicephalus microplus]|uniref:N-acetyltransferase domain-containing protein n=1 Tax=Rhipicephalus microplus TaxID=6941 RepID=A0A9J6D1F2_RHIMP|nr:hypothetical protein HPB51_026897 [Rhipicephalus microplus]
MLEILRHGLSALLLQYSGRCLKSSNRSTLVGDLFFKLTCDRCSPDNVEVLERLKMQWIQVIMLTLYNLHVSGTSGKLGYFRWREHICSFIDKHWTTFFGDRKRTATFRGTVAGVLSSGCPLLFQSGWSKLGENGWWTLTTMKPPSPADFEGPTTLLAMCRKAKMAPVVTVEETLPVLDTPRRRNAASSLQAAMHLKERRALIKPPCKEVGPYFLTFFCAVSIFTQPVVDSCNSDMPDKIHIKTEPVDTGDDTTTSSSFDMHDSLMTPEDFHQRLTELGLDEMEDGLLPVKVEAEDDEALDLEDFDVQEAATMDASYFGVQSPKVEDIVGILNTDGNVAATEEVVAGNMDDDEGSMMSIKEEPVSDAESSSTETSHSRASGTAKKHRMDERGLQATIKEEAAPKKPKCVPMSIYEEHQLLSQIEKYAQKISLPPEAQRLRRKLLVRQIKRARNIPVFDLDALADQLSRQPHKDSQQVTIGTARMGAQSHVSFVTRILGLEEEQLECIVSPYTQRFREESVTQPAEQHPIDFCYVRPQHIPVVNAMCRTFFWPGIDLSESLQYPDFSCVAMYRKLVVGFAFMVPDVKFNEAYIPFIFTHPEWRRSGIAKFMLYHLIQTCMGKDVTLHVSATNQAVLLYQKFGFKVEELILDFYDKYFPADSKECKHAMFLRLSR